MQVNKILTNYNNNYYIQKPIFKSNAAAKALKTTNIGAMPNGFIGKVKTIKANGTEAMLNLTKSTYHQYEIYEFTDDYENIIGSIQFRFNKYTHKYGDDKDHVFVSELRNFSNPNTPYYKKGLEEYKHIGTKLLQLAQMRSFENNCDGNIELVAKNRKEVLDFYKNLGFVQAENIGLFGNPYRLSLSSEAMDTFANKYGGLIIL